MSDTERAARQSDHKAELGDVAGPVHAGRGHVIQIERMELSASRAADGLKRALAEDDETRHQLLNVLQQLSTLQAQLGEWKELHHILHSVLSALSPFDANLHATGDSAVGLRRGRALLRVWRPCQTEVDRLLDFEQRLAYIRQALCPDQGDDRPKWGANIALLRQEVEDQLRDEAWSTEGLIDLADELNQACHCYLNLVDWELRRAVDHVQRLYTRLIGGLL